MNKQGKDRYMQNTWYIWLVVLAWLFLLYLLRKRRRKSAAIRHVKYRKNSEQRRKDIAIMKELLSRFMEKDVYIKLLRECDAGIKMGTASIGEVLEKTTNEKLKKLLEACKEGHEKLKEEIQNKLEQCHDTGKDPNPMAQGMSWMKTNVKLAMDESDATIADLITDGCNMGVKSLSRYLNQYQAADEETKDIAKKQKTKRI